MDIYVPRWALFVLGAVVLVGAAVGITLAVTGGDDGGSEVATVTTTESGTSDGPSIETAVEEEPEEPEKPNCDDLGINPEELNEGSCYEDLRQELVVVNKGSTVELDQLTAKLDSIEATPTLDTDLGSPDAKGTYLVVRLTVTNTTSRPQSFNSGGDMGNISLCGNDIYTEDFGAENNPGINSFVWDSDPIQPNQSRSGTMIFDVPADDVKCLETAGNLTFGNFRDDLGFGKPDQLAVIRTYN